jgi:hypothetical protein
MGKLDVNLTDREKLLKTGLASLLVQYGDRPAARAKMIGNAKAMIGLGQPANPVALPTQDIGTAFGLATKQDGAAFIVPALDYAFASEDQSVRAAIFRALIGNADPELAGDMLRNARNLPYTSSEISALFGGAFGNTAAIDDVWAAFKDVFDEMIVKLPEVRKQQVAAYAGSQCSAAGAADAKAFFESKAAMIPGYERRLAQGLERANLCAAQVEMQIPKLAAALAAR